MIELIGTASGTNSISSMPAHQIGDLIIIFAYRDGNNTAPTVPAGWRSVGSGGGNTNSGVLGYVYATSTSTTSGTWTNATTVIAAVYRGTQLGNVTTGNGASTTVTYPALTFSSGENVGWVNYFAGHRSTNTSLQTPPTGFVNVLSVLDGTDHAVMHSSPGAMPSDDLSAAAVSVGGTSSGWLAMSVELKDRERGDVIYLGSGTGTTTATIPTHQAGDLLVAFAYRDGNTTAPTLPSGWTNIDNSGANTNSGRLAYRVATASNTTSGTWTNATSLIICAFRNAGIGASGVGGSTGGTVTYPAASIAADGRSNVLRFAGHRSVNTNLATRPPALAYEIIANVLDATDHAVAWYTYAGVKSAPSASITAGGTSSGYRTYTLEIVPSAIWHTTWSSPGLQNSGSNGYLSANGSGFTLNSGAAAYGALVARDSGFWLSTNNAVGGRTTITATVGSKADSSSYYVPSSYWNGTDSDPMYWYNRHGYEVYNAIRFTNTGIPQGANISEAYITVSPESTWSEIEDKDVVIIGAEYVDNAAALSSGSDFTSRRSNLGGDEQRWPVNPVAAHTAATSPNIATAIQSVVNRASFGGNLMFFTRRGASQTNGKGDLAAESYASTGTSSYWPKIDITYHVGSTTTTDFKPAANADTACANTGNIFVSDPLYILDSTSNPIHGISRFPNITIPKGSTIVSAYFKFKVAWYSNSTRTDSDYIIVSVDQADNSAQATTSQQVRDRYTNAPAGRRWMRVNMGNTGNEGQYFSSENIGNYIQTVVDRSGWSSGNAISVVWRDSGNSANGLAAYSYQYASGNTNNIPVLTITYVS